MQISNQCKYDYISLVINIVFFGETKVEKEKKKREWRKFNKIIYFWEKVHCRVIPTEK